jgi:hypothetical protein
MSAGGIAGGATQARQANGRGQRHSNFRQINPESPSILPLDGAARIVSGFTENMSDKVVNRFR